MIDATPLLRLYAALRRRQLRKADSVQCQLKVLLSLLKRARNTRFARDHGFQDIGSVGEYQDRVPLRRYEDFWETYWKDSFPVIEDCTWPGLIPFFAVTSGTTTGVTKYIPVSREMVKSNVRASLDLLVHHVTRKPDSRILGGHSFVLGGSTDLVEEAPGVFSGDLSGIAAHETPGWAQSRYYPPLDLAFITDWEEKLERLARGSLELDIRSISGVPSWMLIYFDRLAALRPDSGGKLSALFPNLELVVHGGVNFEPYRRHFDELLAGSHAETREVYPASEGFIGIADRGSGEGLRLVLDNGLFFEFVPLEEIDSANPTRHWIANVECGVDYAIVLSTCAGIWSYIVGDTVRFIDRDIPRILITGRTSYSLSAFGEHLIDEELEEAIAAAADVIDVMITDYSVGAFFPEGPGQRGGHVFIVEFADFVSDPACLDTLADEIDKRLCATNDDYRAHRSENFGMQPPLVEQAKPGTFAAWMKSRGQLGGQHKVPRIINDQGLLQGLREFREKFTG
jgi:hypothetical protein